MSTVLEIVLEFLFEWLMIFPGACYRWVFFKLLGSKKTFQYFVRDEDNVNGFVGFIFTTLIIVGIINLLR